MNQFLSALILTMCLCSCGALGSTTKIAQAGSYEELMTSSISKCEQSSRHDKYFECISELKRIEAMFPNGNWLTDYYIALYEIQATMGNKNPDNVALLQDAKDYIDKLKIEKEADQSEVSTVEGYYYYALIAANPIQNGQSYYTSVLDSYNRALVINPDNPRALLLLLAFKMNMAKSIGHQLDDDFSSLIEKIGVQLDKEDKMSITPHWGTNTYESLKNIINISTEEYPD